MSDLRRLAWLIAAAALVPLMMFWIIEGGFKAREERRAIEARALATSETLQYRVDGVIARQLAGLQRWRRRRRFAVATGRRSAPAPPS